MHLIKVLGLGSPTRDLRIQPLKSRSTMVESFLSSSRTLSQNLRRNGRRSAIQIAGQSSDGMTFLTVVASSSYPSATCFFFFNSFFFSFKNQFPLFLTTHSPRPKIQLFFFFYLFCFVYFHFSFQFTSFFLTAHKLIY